MKIRQIVKQKTSLKIYDSNYNHKKSFVFSPFFWKTTRTVLQLTG